MLHRLALRVLPSLTVLVTEPEVRKRKRLVMMVPGLVAFAIYRLARSFLPLSSAPVLLVLSGLICAGTAAWAYRRGRGASWAVAWRDDGGRRWGWVVGWVGFVYGVQLSLLVLALLRVLANYDYGLHPDGPAMMALIIACTSVARDAFEIGHLRQRQQSGEGLVTFPDGSPFRAFLREQPVRALQWLLIAGGGAGGLMLVLWQLLGGVRSELLQFGLVTVLGGTVTVMGYLAGVWPEVRWPVRLAQSGRRELFRFWWWPGLAFAATYDLVLVGAFVYVCRWSVLTGTMTGLLAGMVTGLLAVYALYLGHRRHLEDRVRRLVPPSLLRCPFVLGFLTRSGSTAGAASSSSAGFALSDSGPRR